MNLTQATELKESLDDFRALALTIWGEARGLSEDGRYAVGCTIRNRYNLKFHGASTIKAVCLARLQYSCWFPVGGVVNYRRLMQTANLMATLPEDKWSVPLILCVQTARRVTVAEEDITEGATHYYHESIEAPFWTRPPALFTAEFDGHLFYRNVK